MVSSARRHADDAGAGGVRPAALDACPARSAGGRGYLSAAVAPALDLCRRYAAALLFAAPVPEYSRPQDALHYRRRGVGRRRQIHHRTRPAGALGTLVAAAKGRPDHDRRLSLFERRAGTAGPDAEEGLSGKL